ncbi:uncharacterized protein [Oscarella lobularis]|uniref:uncharacterized protein isoform X2 n=1 Tax=Oscarella lobularis TaxID=121494 RepID=UPI003313B2E1
MLLKLLFFLFNVVYSEFTDFSRLTIDCSPSIKSDNETAVNAVVNLLCDGDYFLRGASVVCEGNASWSIGHSQCGEGIDCERVRDLKNDTVGLGRNASSVAVEVGENATVRFSCSDGRRSVGVESIRCLPDGTWGKSSPDCESLTSCRFLGFSPNEISSGEELQEKPFSICSGTSISCESLGRRIPARGAISTNKTTNGTEVKFSCKEGYVVNGTASLVCLSGRWSSDLPSCKEIQCNPITPPPDGYAWTSSDGRREKYTSDSESVAFQTLYFECGGQLELIGQSSITCLENGSWSGTVPICSDLRLADGDSKYEGRIEVHYNGSWGTVCDEGFDMEDAFVVCRQLFSTFPANFKLGSYFGRGTFPVVLDDLQCSGTETHLQDCLHRGLGEHRPKCNKGNEAGVVCLDRPFPIRLITKGCTSVEGRLEVFYKGEWGPVCDDEWDLQDAHVVCRQLGLGRAIEAFSGRAHDYGYGKHSILLNDLRCDGSEQVLAQCRSEKGIYARGNEVCRHGEDVALICEDGLCPMINATANMSLTIQSVTLRNVTVTQLFFFCNVGYNLVGPSNIACLESGRWSDTPPVCKKSNECLFTAAFSALAVPIVALALLFLAGAVAVGTLGVSGIRSIFSQLVICFFIFSTASVLAGSLIAVNILSPFKCKTLVVDFVINLYTVLCFAMFFVETVAYLVGRILSRPPIKLAITAVIVILEISIAAMSCFVLVPDGKESEDHCKDARTRPLLVSSYFLNAALAMGIAVVTWITYCRGLESRLKNRSVIECLTASLFAALYVASLCSFLWAKDCSTVVHFLVIIATFPAFLTLHVFTFMARGALARRKESADFERKPDFDVEMNPKVDYWDEDIVKEINTVVISPSQIHKEEQIGRGNFGAVFKGKLKDADVAMKSVLDVMNRWEVNNFVREGLQMRQFDHPNVMKLLGICWSDDPSSPYHRFPLIILPYMELGDLKAYLRKRRPRGSLLSLRDDNPLQMMKVPLEQLVKFSLHIAKGMEYISNKGVVHRDLAARNCMVSWDLEVKVGDFGLSRVMKAGKDYYRTGEGGQLPVRWMAPECLLEFVFTTKSDVWAFGITLWEVMTLGMMPYPGVSNHEVAAFVMSGQRLEKPNECPLDVYDIMRLCWAGKPHQRLSFSKIVQCFEEYLTELRNYVKPSAGFVDPHSHWNMSVAKEVTVAVPQLLSKSEDRKPKDNRASDLASKNFGAMFTLGLESVEC